MFNKNVTAGDLIRSLQVMPLAVQKSKPLQFLSSAYYDLNSFDAPLVGLYEDEQWSVFIYSFYDSNSFFKEFGKSFRYAGAVKNSQGRPVQYNFVHSGDLNFFEFSEELFGVKTLKEEKLYKRSGIGTVYKAERRKAFVNKLYFLSYSFSRIFKSYYWVSEFKHVARYSRFPFPSFVKTFFEKIANKIQSSHDERMDKRMFRVDSKNRFTRFVKIFFIKLHLNFVDLKCKVKVSVMRAIFPKLYFVNKYYRMGYKRVEAKVWDFVQSNSNLKKVMDEEYVGMTPKEQHGQYPKVLFRYILVTGWNSEWLAESFATFGDAGFNKFAKIVASGLTVKEVLDANLADMPEEWLDSLYKVS